jgi:hypothetical protein
MPSSPPPCPPCRFLQQFAQDKFAALDVAHAGRLPVVAVRTFVKSLCPGPEAQVADAISQFVAAAEGAARDVPPEAVSVAGVAEVVAAAFEAGVCGAAAVRDAVKALLPAAALEGDDGEVQAFYSLLAVATARHHRALAPMWAPLLRDGGGGLGGEGATALQKIAAGLAAGGGGDARFKGYVSLLMALINHAGKVGRGRGRLQLTGGRGGYAAWCAPRLQGCPCWARHQARTRRAPHPSAGVPGRRAGGGRRGRGARAGRGAGGDAVPPGGRGAVAAAGAPVGARARR